MFVKEPLVEQKNELQTKKTICKKVHQRQKR
jgi:hypothetical protein